ncbi:MAG: RNA polymerase factor sigma-32 [Bdellovibrionales bacterium]|nr:RNA polymerase factor sigma-32 [Bdellovibrionales bacterium]
MKNLPQKHKRPVLQRDSFDLYLKDVSSVPVLSKEEENKLAHTWFETRDREAGQKLVLSNLRFVIKIAKEYTKYGFKLPELAQEGNMGLLHALDKFDPRKGYRLITYAVWWIRAYIQAYVLRSWSIVRTGTTRVQRKLFSSLQKARRKISLMSPEEPPSRKKLAAALNVSQSEFDQALHQIQTRDVSMDQPMFTEDDSSFGETLPDHVPNAEAKLIEEDTKARVRETLDSIYDELKPRERYLLEHRLLSDTPMTLETAGKEFGVTRERVRQLEERLKAKLHTVFEQRQIH